MKNLLSFFILVFVIIGSLQADEINMKFGKVSMEELGSKSCPIDSNAHAYYIFDKGETTFAYYEGFQIHFERQFRIKILDNNGVENATIVIPFYDYGKHKETVTNIKAVTYSIEGNKIAKQKMNRDAIFQEATSKYISTIKFALPNVTPGSVIEVSYSITSKRLFKLPDWKFQHYIPVLSSLFEVNIPEYFYYNQTQKGYHAIETKKEFSRGMINFKDGSRLDFNRNDFIYSAQNVPAFPVGEYLTTPDNYMSMVEYELNHYEIPGVVYENYNTSWDDVSKLFYEDEDFGQKLMFTGFLKDEAEKINEENATSVEKMVAAFNLVKKSTSWNNRNSCWCSQSLKKTFEVGEGNSADINLLLVALLKEIGLDAYPVALSTRANGIIHPSHPSVSQLNYLVAMCKIDGEEQLLDATEDFATNNILPVRCLNNKGRIIDKNVSAWVSLLKGNTYITDTRYQLKIEGNGSLSGKIRETSSDFAAFACRNAIKGYETQQKYLDQYAEKNAGLEIADFSIENYENIDQNIVINLDVMISDRVETAGDLMFFTPLLFEGYKNNPFSLEERLYPVEYPYPISEKVFSSVEIPDGYQIESTPQAVMYKLLDGKASYTYRVNTDGTTIIVSSYLDIVEPIFLASDYQSLKEFFERIVEKNLEKIVLKKI
ncbi:MAG: DUF3857 domain-containing protein [Prolixibacteraceae bacterium]